MGLEIVLEAQNYVAGDQIKGFVRVTIGVLQQLNGINIKFTGEALTHWSEEQSISDNTNGQTQTRRETVYYNGHEEYCKMQYYLFGSAGNNGRVELHPGMYTYPFTFQIPPTVPPSYVGKWGSVRYIITVTIDIPWAMDVVQEVCIDVKSHLDLNSHRECETPFILTKRKNFCCLCCASLPLNVEVTVPVTGYIPGQSIPLTIECDNRSSVDINTIEFQLVRAVTFHTQHPTTKTRYEKDVIYTLNVGPLLGRKTTTWRKVLDIPVATVPHLKHCGIMTFDYKIVMEAEPSGCHISLDGEIPIILGTMGLMSYQPPSSELEMNNITLTMGAASSTYVPSPPTNIGWNVVDNNSVITEQPPINYYALPDAKYPPPYPIDTPPMITPSAPML